MAKLSQPYPLPASSVGGEGRVGGYRYRYRRGRMVSEYCSCYDWRKGCPGTGTGGEVYRYRYRGGDAQVRVALGLSFRVQRDSSSRARVRVRVRVRTIGLGLGLGLSSECSVTQAAGLGLDWEQGGSRPTTRVGLGSDL